MCANFEDHLTHAQMHNKSLNVSPVSIWNIVQQVSILVNKVMLKYFQNKILNGFLEKLSPREQICPKRIERFYSSMALLIYNKGPRVIPSVHCTMPYTLGNLPPMLGNVTHMSTLGNESHTLGKRLHICSTLGNGPHTLGNRLHTLL